MGVPEIDRPIPTLSVAALGCVSASAWIWLAARSHGPGPPPVVGFLLVMGIAWGATLLAWRFASAVPKTRLLIILWMGAVLFRMAGFAGRPVYEDDHYRYLWDGRSLALTGDPYSKRPIDFFQDSSISDKFQSILDGINYPHLPTIYGPVCEWAFALCYRIAPAELWPWKLLLLAADLSTLLLLLRMTSPAHALLYGWCPLLIFETAFNAHPESLGVLFLVAALYWMGRGKTAWAALAMSTAAGVKLTGGLLAPFLLWKRGRRGWAYFAAGLLALYVPLMTKGGSAGIESLASFARDWEFNSSLYALLSAGLGDLARPLCGAALTAWYLWWLRRESLGRVQSPVIAGYALYGGLFLLSPVVNPWYLLWLLPFATIDAPLWRFASLGAVSLSYLCGLQLGDPLLGPYEHPFWVRMLEYGMIAIVAATGLMREDRMGRRPDPPAAAKAFAADAS